LAARTWRTLALKQAFKKKEMQKNIIQMKIKYA
jgi:hypothetical protein